MATTSAAVRQLSDLNSQGTVLGRSATDLVAFYGATPVARNTTSSGVMVTTFGAAIPANTAISTAGVQGASTAAIMTSTLAAVAALQVDMAELQTLLNNIRTTLVDNGLVDGS